MGVYLRYKIISQKTYETLKKIKPEEWWNGDVDEETWDNRWTDSTLLCGGSNIYATGTFSKPVFSFQELVAKFENLIKALDEDTYEVGTVIAALAMIIREATTDDFILIEYN